MEMIGEEEEDMRGGELQKKIWREEEERWNGEEKRRRDGEEKKR